MNLEVTAAAAAGNWDKFRDFIWDRESELAKPHNWAIIYFSDGLIGKSNAEYISRHLNQFANQNNPTVVFETHSHWLVKSVKGFSIMVYDETGVITSAFTEYFNILRKLDDYAILDESNYSSKVYAATISNMDESAFSLKSKYNLPEDWKEKTYDWFSSWKDSAIEDKDDSGGYPEESDLIEAFEDLGFEKLKENT